MIFDRTGANIQAIPTPEMFLRSIGGLIVTPKNQLWVSQYGSDFADGSIGSPVLTIAKALSIVANYGDAGPTNWYVINLFSGTFTEDVVLAPWVGFIGQLDATTIAGVTATMLPHVQDALAGAFHIAFLACAVAMVPAVIVALGMRDLPLRTTSANEPATEPAPLAH